MKNKINQMTSSRIESSPVQAKGGTISGTSFAAPVKNIFSPSHQKESKMSKQKNKPNPPKKSKNWPSKVPHQPSGPVRDNNPSKKK
jgi:chorismate synthase